MRQLPRPPNEAYTMITVQSSYSSLSLARDSVAKFVYARSRCSEEGILVVCNVHLSAVDLKSGNIYSVFVYSLAYASVKLSQS